MKNAPSTTRSKMIQQIYRAARVLRQYRHITGSLLFEEAQINMSDAVWTLTGECGLSEKDAYDIVRKATSTRNREHEEHRAKLTIRKFHIIKDYLYGNREDYEAALQDDAMATAWLYMCGYSTNEIHDIRVGQLPIGYRPGREIAS